MFSILVNKTKLLSASMVPNNAYISPMDLKIYLSLKKSSILKLQNHLKVEGIEPERGNQNNYLHNLWLSGAMTVFVRLDLDREVGKETLSVCS